MTVTFIAFAPKRMPVPRLLVNTRVNTGVVTELYESMLWEHGNEGCMLHVVGKYVDGLLRYDARNITPRKTATIISTHAYVTMNSRADCCRFECALPISIESLIESVDININTPSLTKED